MGTGKISVPDNMKHQPFSGWFAVAENKLQLEKIIPKQSLGEKKIEEFSLVIYMFPHIG